MMNREFQEMARWNKWVTEIRVAKIVYIKMIDAIVLLIAHVTNMKKSRW
ncbi:hypothetical protein [Enterocloster bolteae]|nr:hypothetical protein [Enterocloster bolteae]